MKQAIQFFPRQVVEAGGNRWDWALLPIVLAVFVLLAYGAAQMVHPYHIGEPMPVSLDPDNLPYYLLRTTLRMFIALGASILFSCVFAVVAAKNKAAEKVLVPLLDILQSIPILGFLSITVTGFIALFPGNLFGVECAAIFAIFTSQAWNMAFSLYQSMRTVPIELQEAADVFQLSAWQRFWRLELPYAMPGLLWNMMMSMSGGWFFVVASEAISVSHQNIMLPGIGSYIATAIEARDLTAVGWAIGAMLMGILLYDQLFFRPLLAWADKFRFEESESEIAPQSWLLDWMRRTERSQGAALAFVRLRERSFLLFRRPFDGTSVRASPHPTSVASERIWDAAIAAADADAMAQRLRSAWGAASQRFRTAAEQVANYRERILPKANAALRLVQTGFEQGKFGFMDLLDTQRTAAEVRLAYQRKLLELNLAQAEIEAFLGREL